MGCGEEGARPRAARVSAPGCCSLAHAGAPRPFHSVPAYSTISSFMLRSRAHALCCRQKGHLANLSRSQRDWPDLIKTRDPTSRVRTPRSCLVSRGAGAYASHRRAFGLGVLVSPAVCPPLDDLAHACRVNNACRIQAVQSHAVECVATGSGRAVRS